ncbi:MAG: hypothetical protein SCARUB_02017 [Candidatus Scalindua rubra]|uniref:Uncharacterized protein n=1 Tax=Candidatus Scalindua rubra TaxID=1872076 RepID=A0A1E3XB75_9BACT|nr:MAG: hypothetical protein SCARUB_02017 [Candidatus Scalindua rubra]
MVEIRKIIDGFKHAFATEGVKLADNDIDLIRKLADYVVRRNMSVPAIMFLESVRPLNFISSQAMIFFKPILTNFFSRDEYDKLAIILEKREVVDLLINEIEKKSSK